MMPPFPSTEPVPPTGAPFDLDKALRIWREAGVYHKSLRRFVQQYAGFPAELAQNLGAGDGPAVAAMLHKLKGTAGSLMLEEIAHLAAEMEQAAVRGSDAAALLPALEAAWARAFEAISRLDPPPDAGFGSHSPAPADPAAARPLLHSLLGVLSQNNLSDAEPLIAALQSTLPGPALAPVQTCLDDFDFRGAEAEIHRLAATFGITLEG